MSEFVKLTNSFFKKHHSLDYAFKKDVQLPLQSNDICSLLRLSHLFTERASIGYPDLGADL